VKKIALITSHGGHLTEMLSVIEAFEGQEIFFVTYEGMRLEELARHYRAYALKNIGTSPWRLLKSMTVAWRILRRERPDAVVSTGSEIAIPFFVLAKVLRIRSVFIESVCRIHSASGTGKVVYPLADVFLVQWPQTLEAYGTKARYEGGLL
jgi:beta-1,4-N-acetylglucosaminyltransferase